MHLFRETDEDWQRIAIGERLTFTPTSDGGISASTETTGDALAMIVSFFEGHRASAALITGHDARVTLNGYPALGVTALEDRDEIAFGSQRFLFGAFEPQEPGPVEPGDIGKSCPRCNTPLGATDMIRRCSSCGAAHHVTLRAPDAPPQTDPRDQDCDACNDACAGCGRERSAMLWTPDEND